MRLTLATWDDKPLGLPGFEMNYDVVTQGVRFVKHGAVYEFSCSFGSVTATAGRTDSECRLRARGYVNTRHIDAEKLIDAKLLGALELVRRFFSGDPSDPEWVAFFSKAHAL